MNTSNTIDTAMARRMADASAIRSASIIGQPVGWVCLNVGVGLACAGVAWIDAIAAGAEGRP